MKGSGRGDGQSAAVREALQRYADRGVFRGFSVRPGRGGTEEFRFTWLTREPMIVRFDEAGRTLAFLDVLPGVRRGSAVEGDVEALVESRSASTLPAHRRIDRRRAAVRCERRRGRVSIVVTIRGRQHAYAVQRGLNLVNEVFILLRAAHPEYLSDVFGLPAE